MRKLLLLFLLIVFAAPVFAEDITLRINQSEYYFLVGQDAMVPLETENDYGKQIDGTLSYKIVQEINQGGFHSSSTNSQSTGFSVNDGGGVINIGLGTSSSPATLKIELSFNYNDGEEKVVNLDEIIVYFVSDESEQKNQQNQQESKSESMESEEQDKQNMMEQMQEKLDQMFNQQEEEKPPTAQDNVQNNQMAQDSNALKEQIKNQMEEQKRLNEEFQKQLSQNEEFMKKHEEIISEGYEQKGGKVEALNESSGDFEINYEKDGETASINGSMENGNLTNMQKTSSEDLKKLMEKIKQDERFNEFNEELMEEGFKQGESMMQQEGNVTQVSVPYTDEGNKTATITATIEDEEIKEVKLEKEKNYYWWYLLLIPFFVVWYLIYLKYFKKKELIGETENKKIEKPIDYRKESLKLLEEAKKLFSDGSEKDAYGKAGEAIRFYYSYKFDVKTELTNSEIIKLLKKKKLGYNQTQDCLNLCGLVEFAKYKSNKKDFDDIISLAKKVIL